MAKNKKVNEPEQVNKIPTTEKIDTTNEKSKPGFSAKDLIGLTVKVNYNVASVFFDPLNKIYIGVNPDKNLNVYKIETEIDLTNILSSLKLGRIYLFDGEKNVSEKFGGVIKTVKKNMTPLVKISFKEPDKEKEETILKILKNDIDKVVQSILNITDQVTLKRLRELELHGYNLVGHGRVKVLDELDKKIIKKIKR